MFSLPCQNVINSPAKGKKCNQKENDNTKPPCPHHNAITAWPKLQSPPRKTPESIFVCLFANLLHWLLRDYVFPVIIRQLFMIFSSAKVWGHLKLFWLHKDPIVLFVRHLISGMTCQWRRKECEGEGGNNILQREIRRKKTSTYLLSIEILLTMDDDNINCIILLLLVTMVLWLFLQLIGYTVVVMIAVVWCLQVRWKFRWITSFFVRFY